MPGHGDPTAQTLASACLPLPKNTSNRDHRVFHPMRRRTAEVFPRKDAGRESIGKERTAREPYGSGRWPRPDRSGSEQREIREETYFRPRMPPGVIEKRAGFPPVPAFSYAVSTRSARTALRCERLNPCIGFVPFQGTTKANASRARARKRKRHKHRQPNRPLRRHPTRRRSDRLQMKTPRSLPQPDEAQPVPDDRTMAGRTETVSAPREDRYRTRTPRPVRGGQRISPGLSPAFFPHLNEKTNPVEAPSPPFYRGRRPGGLASPANLAQTPDVLRHIPRNITHDYVIRFPGSQRPPYHVFRFPLRAAARRSGAGSRPSGSGENERPAFLPETNDTELTRTKWRL